MHSIILQAQAQQGGNWSMLVMLGLMFVIMYFFMIRPQQKKAKEQKVFIDEVKRGDYVVTIGGAHGRIAELEGDTFILEVEKGGRIRFSKSAISMESTKAAVKKEA
ncbi:MAG: preprotein translocase subunit YajC [Bacteroidota bacterium]